MENKTPLVSVLMPCYNNEKFLPEAIESILNQTYKNFEFIILDDFSTDNSWEIIKKYAKKDKRIKAYRNKKNLKIVKTRNKLFELASNNSKYFAIFDSDDVSMPERLEKEVKYLEKNSKVGVVGSNLILIDENGKVIGYRKYKKRYKIKDPTILYKSPVAQPSVMIRREILDKYNLRYSTDNYFDRARDFDLWVKIGDVSEIHNIQKPLLKYRISQTQGKKTHMRETLKSTLQIQKKWLFKREYFTLKLLFIMISECFLLLLPKHFVLWLFKKLEVQRKWK